MTLQLDRVVAAYRVTAQYPELISARILNCSKASVNVHSVWIQKVLERQSVTKFRQTVFSDYKSYTLTSPPTDITNEYNYTFTHKPYNSIVYLSINNCLYYDEPTK